MCPVCGKPGLLRARCRCSLYCIKCEDDHEWHRCPIHKVLVKGDAHNPSFPRSGECTCPTILDLLAEVR